MSATLDKNSYAELLAASSGLNRLDGYRTLVLNADYQPFSVLPLSTLGWRDAILGLLSDKYTVEAEYEGVYIRSPSIKIGLPSVIVRKVFRNPEQTVPFTKRMVYIRDEFTCQYCAKEFAPSNLTFDHVIPRAEGGGTDWENIVAACESCNRAKGRKTNWRSPSGKVGPLNEPYRPTYYQLAGKVRKRSLIIPDGCGWENFIQWEGPLYISGKHGHTHQISGRPEDIGDEMIGM
tara:strand:- start:10 stop:711 length:702 start_codon:yes stop_codon:yes gene_type:complete